VPRGSIERSETAGDANTLKTPRRPVLEASAIRCASFLYYFTGLAGFFGQAGVLGYVLWRNKFPVVLGIQLNGDGPFEAVGVRGMKGLTAAAAVVGVGEVIAARWLSQSRLRGGVLALGLWPLGVFLWIGFALPMWLITAPIKILLVLAGWRSLGGRARATQERVAPISL
jgi:hypothetical protein